MKVRIIKDRFGGMGWRAEPGVLHLGGVGTAGVESLSFALPEEWSGMAVTLHIEQEGGTLPQPVLLDESREVTIGIFRGLALADEEPDRVALAISAV